MEATKINRIAERAAKEVARRRGSEDEVLDHVALALNADTERMEGVPDLVRDGDRLAYEDMGLPGLLEQYSRYAESVGVSEDGSFGSRRRGDFRALELWGDGGREQRLEYEEKFAECGRLIDYHESRRDVLWADISAEQGRVNDELAWMSHRLSDESPSGDCGLSVVPERRV